LTSIEHHQILSPKQRLRRRRRFQQATMLDSSALTYGLRARFLCLLVSFDVCELRFRTSAEVLNLNVVDFLCLSVSNVQGGSNGPLFGQSVRYFKDKGDPSIPRRLQRRQKKGAGLNSPAP
jgi:hypothetical protein